MALSAKRPSGAKHPNSDTLDKFIEATPQKRLTVSIDVELHAQIKAWCSLNRTTVKEETERLWRKKLQI